jgi:hypothetical protein
MERKLTDLSIIELKATAYDTLAQIQQLQGNLTSINAELNTRFNLTNSVKSPDPQTTGDVTIV